jgi:hypothetical protein
MRCPCGSSEDSWWEHDARGIPLARVCDQCFDERITKRYRADVLTDSNYWADEPIEPEE